MNELNTKIIELSKDGGIEAMLEMEKLLEQALLQNPQNINLLLRLAILEQEVPLADHHKSIAVLESVLKIDPSNAIALILLAYVHYHNIGVINGSLFEQLISNPTKDPEIKSMLKYTASWLYAPQNDKKNVEKWLIESITECQSHVYNYSNLAELSLKQNRYAEAKKLIQHGLKNVEKLYIGNIGYADETDIQEFLGERIKGIYLTDMNYNRLKVLEAEAILREQLVQDPLNIDLLLRLSIIERGHFNADFEQRTASLQKALKLDPDSVTALLILAYVSYLNKKTIDEPLFKKLIAIKTHDPEINSMLLYAASWFYVGKDATKQEELLRQSIYEYPNHRNNYYDLANLCTDQNRFSEAKAFREKAIKNITKVYSFEEDMETIADLNRFLNESIKGIYIHEDGFKYLQEQLANTPNA